MCSVFYRHSVGGLCRLIVFFFFSSRRRHTRFDCDWSSDVCSSDLYLSVLLSIILGLGLTQVLTAVGRLVRHRDRVRPDWLPLLWAAVLLVVYVQVDRKSVV